MRISDWSSDVCSSDLDCCAAPCWRRFRAIPPVQPENSHARQITRFPRTARLPRLRHGVRYRRYPAGQALARQHGAPYEDGLGRSEEHTSELQSLMRISYAVFCLKKKKKTKQPNI